MLYISRRFSVSQYGVVDSDDDTETKVYGTQIHDLVTKLGVRIKGVIMSGDSVSEIVPYQDPRYCNSRQARLRTLKGIDIRIWRGIIVYIHINGRHTGGHISVRLSEYAPKFSGKTNIDWSNVVYSEDKDLTLILDDKLEVVDDCPFPLQSRIVWDVREYSNISVIRKMYSFLAGNGLEEDAWSQYIIDTDFQRSFYKA